MPDINPGLPIIGQPDSTEEPKVVTALSQLIAAVNNVDSAQIADGTIVTADLADAAVATAKIAAGAVDLSKLGAGVGTRLLGFLNSDSPHVFGQSAAHFLNDSTGVSLTHTRTAIIAVMIWGFYNPGPATTTITPEVMLDGVSLGVLGFIPTLVAGESCVVAAGVHGVVTPGVHSWNGRATQGANAVTATSQGPALLAIFEQY